MPVNTPTCTTTVGPDIWAIILPFLHKSRPNALTGRYAFESSQPELASAMRVSKMFHDIAGRILYREAVIEDIRRFTFGLSLEATATKRSSPGWVSKNELLSFTKKVFFEYPNFSPGHHTLMRNGDWQAFTDLKFRPEIERKMGDEWCTDASPKSKMLADGASSKDLGIFSRLDTIAVASIFSNRNSWWTRVFPDGNLKGHTSHSAERPALHLAELITATSPRQFCQRALTGPLSIDNLFLDLSPHSISSCTSHFSMHHPHAPFISGVEHRWVCEDNITQKSFNMFRVQMQLGPDSVQTIFDSVESSAREIASLRQFEKNQGYPEFENRVYNIKMYAGTFQSPTSETDNGMLRSSIAKAANNIQQKVLRAKGGSRDTVKWRPVCDAPRCEACGSEPVEKADDPGICLPEDSPVFRSGVFHQSKV